MNPARATPSNSIVRILYVAAQVALVSSTFYFYIHLFPVEADRLHDVSLRTPSPDRQYPIQVKGLRVYVSLYDYIEDTIGPAIYLAPLGLAAGLRRYYKPRTARGLSSGVE